MRLSDTDIRITQQRRVIPEELEKMRSHPTADELYEVVRRRLPHISLGTVYRNLEILSNGGLAGKIEIGGSQRRFDISTPKPHYHIRCTNCGALEDVKSVPTLDIEKIFQDKSGYRIMGYQLILTGLCPECRKAKSQKTTLEEK